LRAVRSRLVRPDESVPDALVQTVYGPDILLRLVEERPYHRLGNGSQEAVWLAA
jgi:hypothetical protein